MCIGHADMYVVLPEEYSRKDEAQDFIGSSENDNPKTPAGSDLSIMDPVHCGFCGWSGELSGLKDNGGCPDCGLREYIGRGHGVCKN